METNDRALHYEGPISNKLEAAVMNQLSRDPDPKFAVMFCMSLFGIALIYAVLEALK